MLAGEVLRLAAGRFPGKPAVVEGERALTFAGLDRDADRFAAALAAAGVAKGERVAILSPNSLDYPIAFYGAARAGAILVTLSTRASAADVARIVELTGPKLLVAHEGLAGLLAGALSGRAPPRLVASGAIDGVEPLAAFLASAGDAPPQVALGEDDALAMSFTGGTTGRPKGVLVSHRARHASAVAAGVEFGLDERDVVVVATPLFHTAGLFVCFHPAVMLGATSVMLPRWDPGAFLRLVEDRHATASLLVPTQIGDLLGHPEFSPARLATLRHLGYAGSPMPLALYDRLAAALPHVELVENYGQSETGPLAIRRAFHPHDKRGSVGRPAHNVALRVVDPAGWPVADGTVGEIVTRGEHVFAGYWGDGEETAAAFRYGGGWLATGDLGYRDADGFIWLVDRAKDLIVSGGENIFPGEIEAALFRHPAVAECAVFGIPDERWGEVPAAHVVLRAGASATPEELAEFAAGLVARYKRPRLVRIVASLPKTAVGKIQKAAIRDDYWAGRGRKI